MGVKLNSTSGSITMTPEDGAGNVAVTLPRAGVATLVADASQAEMEAGTETANRAMSPENVSQAISGQAGVVLQVVQNHYIGTTSQSLVFTVAAAINNVNATITPSSTSSRIKVSVRWAGEYANSSIHNLNFGIMRDGTSIGLPAASGVRITAMAPVLASYAVAGADADSTPESAMITYIDSPASTSALTYSMSAISNTAATTSLFTNRSVSSSGP